MTTTASFDHSAKALAAVSHATAAAGPTTNPTLTAALLVVTGCMALAPMPVLGPAIGWPGSLGQPAATQLAAIGQAPGAVAAGYGLYLAYSVLVLPAFGLAAHRLLGGFSRSLVMMIVALAALSALARSIGILRWLTVMPELSRAHGVADPQGRAHIELVFRALNSYGGGVGELLGVSLFAGLALLLLVLGAALARAVPRWLTALGGLASVALLGMMLPVVGVSVDVPIALAVTLLSLWMWALGGWMLLARRSTAG